MKAFFSLLALAGVANALHMYIDTDKPKCFFEELPKDTLVVGNYRAEEWDENIHGWRQMEGVSVYISVEETFDNDHRVVSQHGGPGGRFTMTAADAGEHKICFTPESTTGKPGWLSVGTVHGGVKLTLDLVIGETSKLESTDKTQLEDLEGRLRDLNHRLVDIRREQVFQREREADFRDQSESTNARVVRWIIIQLVILGITCAWQLSHLRSFFIKQKLT